MSVRLLAIAIVLLILDATPTPLQAQANKPSHPAPGGAATPIIRALLDEAAALTTSAETLDQADAKLARAAEAFVESGTAADEAALCDLAFHAQRLTVVRAVSALPPLTQLLVDRPAVRELLFAYCSDDDGSKALDVLKTLDRRYGAETVDEFATLSAALSLVHDMPLPQLIKEAPRGPGPTELFAYFREIEKKTIFGIRSMPTELLVYVVDARASIEELRWALARYRNQPELGARFFEVPYDYGNFYQGTERACVAKGYTLQSIREAGGVCRDQAYFAEQVGKAMGVPTLFAFAAAAEVSHAWIGFFEPRGKDAWWNLQRGRYDVYKGVVGQTFCPQTHNQLSESRVSVLAALTRTTPQARQTSLGYTIVAERAGAASGERSKLALIQKAIDLNPANLRAWDALMNMARSGALTLADKQRLADVIVKSYARDYPDFCWSVLRPMVESIDDREQRDRIYTAAFRLFQQRADLAASIRMAQGTMWHQAGQSARAGRCFGEVVSRYVNAGPFVIEALEACEKALLDSGNGGKVLKLYADAFGRTLRPTPGAYANQSNFYRIGSRYANRLALAGRHNDAERVRIELSRSVRGPASPKSNRS